MNRDELITITATSSDCDPALVIKIIDTFLDTIVTALSSQERVELRTDFGSFVVREKGGDTANGQQITKVQRVVSFKATPTLKKSLRQDDQEFVKAHQKRGEVQISRMIEE